MGGRVARFKNAFKFCKRSLVVFCFSYNIMARNFAWLCLCSLRTQTYFRLSLVCVRRLVFIQPYIYMRLTSDDRASCSTVVTLSNTTVRKVMSLFPVGCTRKKRSVCR